VHNGALATSGGYDAFRVRQSLDALQWKGAEESFASALTDSHGRRPSAWQTSRKQPEGNFFTLPLRHLATFLDWNHCRNRACVPLKSTRPDVDAKSLRLCAPSIVFREPRIRSRVLRWPAGNPPASPGRPYRTGLEPGPTPLFGPPDDPFSYDLKSQPQNEDKTLTPSIIRH